MCLLPQKIGGNISICWVRFFQTIKAKLEIDNKFFYDIVIGNR